jgi:uncharacterized protein with FMN-binding domain
MRIENQIGYSQFALFKQCNRKKGESMEKKRLKKCASLILMFVLAVSDIGVQTSKAAGTTAQTAYEDGYFTGKSKGYRQGTVTVIVRISNGKISTMTAKAGKDKKKYFKKAKTVIKKIVKKQSVSGVDTVTGATKSSKAIIKAAGEALKKAKKRESAIISDAQENTGKNDVETVTDTVLTENKTDGKKPEQENTENGQEENGSGVPETDAVSTENGTTGSTDSITAGTDSNGNSAGNSAENTTGSMNGNIIGNTTENSTNITGNTSTEGTVSDGTQKNPENNTDLSTDNIAGNGEQNAGSSGQNTGNGGQGAENTGQNTGNGGQNTGNTESDKENSKETPSETPDPDTDSSTAVTGWKDGTYTGTGMGMNGTITATVTISGGVVSSVSCSGSDDAPYFDDAKSGIISRYYGCSEASGAPSVDAVTGATYSSAGIISAISSAISQAQ